MTNEYLPLAVLFALSIGLAFLVVGLGHWFGPKRPSQRKSASYESGMKPIGPGTRRISIRFYLIAVLFILFDIEIVFFLPWAVTLQYFKQNGLGLFALVEMLVFVGILLVGYIYAWKKGALEWE